MFRLSAGGDPGEAGEGRRRRARRLTPPVNKDNDTLTFG